MRSLFVPFVALTITGCAESKPAKPDSYDILLHSASREAQREALDTILQHAKDYLPRLQRSLQDYPKTLPKDWTAANRAVHLAARLRDPSFPPILARILEDSVVIDECTYDCPVIFAIAIHSAFGGWPPPPISMSLPIIGDVHEETRNASRTSLDKRPLSSLVQGPMLERHQPSIERMSEEELIETASSESSDELGRLAAFALSGSVTTSKNLNELYLLIMNDSKADASREYRTAIYQAIYRAEAARARGQ